MKGFTVTCFPAQVCPSEEMLTQLGFAPRLGMATHSSGSSSTFEMKSSAPFSQPVAGFAGHACKWSAQAMKFCSWVPLKLGSRAAARIPRRISSLSRVGFAGAVRCGLRERFLVPRDDISRILDFCGGSSATFLAPIEMKKVVPGPFAKRHDRARQRDEPPRTPRGYGTTPGRWFHGGRPGEEREQWGDEGVRCMRCGRRWDGNAQCDCSSPEPPSPPTPTPSPRVHAVAQLLLPRSTRLSSEDPLLSADVARRLQERAGRLGEIPRAGVLEAVVGPPLPPPSIPTPPRRRANPFDFLASAPRTPQPTISPTQSFSVSRAFSPISPTQPFTARV